MTNIANIHKSEQTEATIPKRVTIRTLTPLIDLPVNIEAAIMPLIIALDDENWRTREAAVKALGKLGNPKVVESLIIALNDTNCHVREAAAKALRDMYNKNIGKQIIDNHFALTTTSEKLGLLVSLYETQKDLYETQKEVELLKKDIATLKHVKQNIIKTDGGNTKQKIIKRNLLVT